MGYILYSYEELRIENSHFLLYCALGNYLKAESVKNAFSFSLVLFCFPQASSYPPLIHRLADQNAD